MEGFWKSKWPLKGLGQTPWLKGTHPRFWCGTEAREVPGSQGRNWVYRYRVRAGGTAAIVPVLNPLPTQPILNLQESSELYLPHPGDFLKPCPPNSQCPGLFQREAPDFGSLQNKTKQARKLDSQRSIGCRQAVAGLSVPGDFCLVDPDSALVPNLNPH